MRLVHKRTWPEFLDALHSGEYTGPDCEILSYLRSINAINGTAFARELGDAPLDTEVVTGGRVRRVADVCVDAGGECADRQSLVSVAKGLVLNADCTDAVLQSKVATRRRALKAAGGDTIRYTLPQL